MIIRDLDLKDVEPLRDIYNYYVRTSTVTFETEELTFDAMRRRLFDPVALGYPCLVAEECGMTAGYCALHPWRPRFDTTAEATLYLAPDARGKGIGRQLTARMVELARASERIHALIACINADNAASRRIVETIGFMQVAHYREVGRKFGQWLDDVEYELLV